MSIELNGKIYKATSDKEGMLHLNLSNKGIKDINEIHGLDQLINLSSLSLDKNNINVIQGLDNFPILKKLSLNDNSIEEITGLENLKNLEVLGLEGNNISKISGLQNLIKLKDLYLWRNNITELSGLENLLNLRMLGISQNPISKWMSANFGSPPYNKTAVRYCKKLVEGDNFDDSDILNFIVTARQVIVKIIQNSYEMEFTKKEVIKVYNEVLSKFIEIFDILINKRNFFPIFGEIFSNYIDFFSIVFFERYNKTLAQKLGASLLYEFESSILKKYCLFDEEEILEKVHGEILEYSLRFTGRIYITSYRIITQGLYEFIGGGRTIDIMLITWGTSKLKRKIKFKSMKKESGDMILPSFGYEYSFSENTKIKTKASSIKFGPYTLKPTQGKNESKEEFKKRLLKIADIISKVRYELNQLEDDQTES